MIKIAKMNNIHGLETANDGCCRLEFISMLFFPYCYKSSVNVLVLADLLWFDFSQCSSDVEVYSSVWSVQREITPFDNSKLTIGNAGCV